MQLRFIIFYKIISLRSVPHNQARPTANPPSPINCYKQIQNWAVLALFYARMQRFFYRLGHPPSFYSGIFPTAVINYFALYSEAGSLPRLKLRTAYAFFLTIRQSQRRIRFHRRKNQTKVNPRWRMKPMYWTHEVRHINLKQKTFNKKHWSDFNAITKPKSIHDGVWSQCIEHTKSVI